MCQIVTNQQQNDPTGTSLIRTQYERQFEEWFNNLIDEIRPSSFNQDVSPPPQVFQFETDDAKIQAFMDWLRTQEQNGLLTIIERNNNTYIQRAYEEGIEHAETALQGQGLTVEEIGNVFALPVHRDTLQRLFTRNFAELQGITEEMNRQISRELTDGFAQGRNPNVIASNIASTVEDIGLQRSRLLARTEVINAHSEATLSRFEQFGVEEVGIQAEILTAGDRRVCPLCLALAARGPMTIESVRSETWEFDPEGWSDAVPSQAGEYSRKPPIHPSCRCALVPVV